MSVEQFTGGLEPQDREAVIWRFMELWKFQDLVSSRELHFSRADLLGDAVIELSHALRASPQSKLQLPSRKFENRAGSAAGTAFQGGAIESPTH